MNCESWGNVVVALFSYAQPSLENGFPVAALEAMAMRENGQARVRQHFSRHQMVASISETYDQLLAAG